VRTIVERTKSIARAKVKHLLAATLTMFALQFPCTSSQGQQQAEVFVASELLKAIINPIGFAVLAKELCGVEGADVGQRAVAAIDRRYQHCVAENARWVELPSHLGYLRRGEDPRSVPIGSRALAAFQAEYGAKAKADAERKFCKGPWSLALVPLTDLDIAKAEFLRTEPTMTRQTLDFFLNYLEQVHAIADDARWGKAPCDAFFPLR
jgi:hypothetical protein